ncbi:response regulator [Paenibacillus chartarius]|uniref:Response regulator n=1 Tax=Paenibacillus chartarius TaxID=747481 RepID=A0ABV6DPJ0_9BACL
MKLLLVEDERLTREGILESVDWSRLHISEVKEAVDGMDALAVCEAYEPDIVLTDIKMPRMDGVALASQLRRKYPNCKIVFMSGYAEKEYLKAAITLKAISYVEKPLDVDEVEAALATAVSEHEAERKQQQMLSLSAEKAHLLKRQAAQTLTRPNADRGDLAQELSWLPGSITPEYAGVTCMVKLDREHPELDELERLLESSAAEYGVAALMFAKDDRHVVVQLIAPDRSKLSATNLKDVFSMFSYELRGRQVKHDIAIGVPVAGLAHAHESYITAVVLLQESFFRGPYSLILYGDPASTSPKEPHTPDPKHLERFKEMLAQEKFDDYERLVRQLSSEFRRAPGTPVNQVKELYYRLVQELEHYFHEAGLHGETGSEAMSAAWERMFECRYLGELQDILLAKLQVWHKAWETHQKGHGHISSKIVKYVHQHYADDHLSVQEISDHLQLSMSYVISVFKEATGTTVKQYVLEYRIEKARELLKERSLKVSDIAGQVGFKDGEYFAKVFRKFTGMTPSEYRERFQ